jgi:hypothetical protein
MILETGSANVSSLISGRVERGLSITVDSVGENEMDAGTALITGPGNTGANIA